VVSGAKLTVYFGERDRAGDRFLADALCDVFARHELAASLVMRGTTGFGAEPGSLLPSGGRLRTDRLLTLSEDLPLVAVGIDAPERVSAALQDVEALAFDGLVTLERASDEPPATGTAKLTVYMGRREPYDAVVAALHRHGVAGATVLLGVDGTAHGERRRARFLGRNSGVPLMVISVGEAETLAAALPEITAMLERPIVTWERVRVCKRDGRALEAPEPAEGDAWQKIMVYGSHPLYLELVRWLRATGAAGATTLRGVWGYHGDHAPHGESAWQLRRSAPVVTVIVDRPESVARWWGLLDELTAETGLVTSELVPTVHPRAGA
jgi:PII-like signaling protein